MMNSDTVKLDPYVNSLAESNTKQKLKKRCEANGVCQYRKMGYGERSKRLTKSELAEGLVTIEQAATLHCILQGYSPKDGRDALRALQNKIAHAAALLAGKEAGDE